MSQSSVAVPISTHLSDAERAVRIDLAACYRLVALYGWDDLVFTHISARVPGPEHHFLINPYGMMFEEITASSLVKVDADGNALGNSPYAVNPAGFTIHSAVHEVREDAGCVIHLHTPDGTAVATSSTGLLPLNQTAQLVLPDLAYHDYEGVALDLDERPRLQRDLSRHNIMLLRNHGTLTVGRSVAEAFLRMYLLERACTMQVSDVRARGHPAPDRAGRDREKRGACARRRDVNDRRQAGMAGLVAKARPCRPELSELTAASNLPCLSAVSRSCGRRNASRPCSSGATFLDCAEILKDVDCRVKSGTRSNVMPHHLKRGVDASAIKAADAKVREMVEFRSVVDAVRCAIEMQNGMIERNAGLPPERRIEFRVGIHLGDVVEESDGDLMGDSVNIAARLECIADPGGICLSEDAYRDRLKEGFADLGEKELKNIARPVRVFAIKTASSGVTQELIASTPELGGDPEQEYFGGRQARRCAARGA